MLVHCIIQKVYHIFLLRVKKKVPYYLSAGEGMHSFEVVAVVPLKPFADFETGEEAVDAVVDASVEGSG